MDFALSKNTYPAVTEGAQSNIVNKTDSFIEVIV